ncbi:MAG TPA: sigma factor, partial [Mycobacteriales bacterium]|nr:sigma factor [Mycobacteriales bacterium]
MTDRPGRGPEPHRHAEPPVEDASLIIRMGRGDEAALEAVYQRYGGACYRLARRILDEPHLAEDVVQQVFLALWQGSGYDP